MIVFLNGEGFEAALPNMTGQAVSHVVTAAVGGQQPMDPGGQVVRVGGPEDEVEMVGHEAITKNPHGDMGVGLAEKVAKGGVVVRAVEDFDPAVAAIDDMVTVAADGGSGGAWHRIIVGNGAGDGKKNEACPHCRPPLSPHCPIVEF